MDIWEWVYETTNALRESGQAHLADLVEEIPQACAAGHHQRVENMVPEALSLARAAKNHWLEVFIRHWLLQSRVLHRHDVSRDTLGQAVSLIEFATRHETHECPQAVCAVQDLASAYGIVDGFGYAEERLAVTEEALARIDPTWPCFDCVSTERGNVLLDLGRYQAALDLCDSQIAKAPVADAGIQGVRFRALAALERYSEAASVAAGLDNPELGESDRLRNELFEALAAAKLGNSDEARAVLPAFSRLQPANFVDWLRSARALGAGEPNPNTWRIERQIAAMSRLLSDSQSYFTLARVQKLGAELAIQRSARESAARHIDAAEETAKRLRDPSWLVPKLARLREALSHIPEPARAADVEALRESLGSDPEHDLALLSDAALPAEPEWASSQARALAALGRNSEAIRALEIAARRWPEDARLATTLLGLVREQGDHEKLEALYDLATGSARDAAREVLVQSLSTRGETGKARRLCEEALAEDPERHESRSLLATLLRDAGQLDAALEHLSVLVASHEPGNFDWDRMLVATLAERWDLVRESARRLELELEDETGPIDERWAPCQIRVQLADGSERAYFAWRTGPVTARIDHVVYPTVEQHHGDLVAFDATPLNHEAIQAARAEERDADADTRPPLQEFAAYRILAFGNYRSTDICGVGLSDETIVTLKHRLGESGIVWEELRGGDEEVDVDGERLRSTYAFLGLPVSLTDAQVHELLSRLRAEFSLRLVWPELAKAVGDPTADEHEQARAAWSPD